MSSAKASSRFGAKSGSASGRLRTCQWNSQVFGTMLVAVPPSMVPTCTVENGGSKRSLVSRDASAAPMRSISSISSAAKEMAFTPSRGRLE